MRRALIRAFPLLVALAAGCQRTPNVDDVPVGADVQVIRHDGGLVEGTLAERTPTTVKVDTGTGTRLVHRDDIADVRLTSASVPEPPPQARFFEVIVPAQTRVRLRLTTPVSSESSRAEDRVAGELAAPVVVNGSAAIPAGATARGVVTQAVQSGRVKGRARLALRFDTLAVGDDHYPIRGRFSRQAPATKRADAEKIGIPAAGGAIIGAIAGGQKGAAIGATAGGGIGAAVVLNTPGKPVTLARGAILTLVLGEPVTIRVPIR